MLFRLAKLRQPAKYPLPPASAGLAFSCVSWRARLPATPRPPVRRQYRDAHFGVVLCILRPLLLLSCHRAVANSQAVSLRYGYH